MDSRSGKGVTQSPQGFSLVELLMVVAVIGILAGIGMPMFGSAMDATRLSASARDVERELQTARLKAVATKRPMRVRFDCPEAGQFRMVELIGTSTAPASADLSTDRCSDLTWPYPSSSQNALVRPTNDGPVRRLALEASFTQAQTLEFWPDGTVHANLSGMNPWPVIPPSTPVTITVAHKYKTKTITVNGVGKVQIQ